MIQAVTNIHCPFDSHWGLRVGPHHCSDCCCLVCRASTVWLLWKSSRATVSRCPSEKRWCTLKSKSPLVCTAQPGARGNVWAGGTQRESDPHSPHLQTLDHRHEYLEDRTSWGWAAPVLCCPFPQAANTGGLPNRGCGNRNTQVKQNFWQISYCCYNFDCYPPLFVRA